MGKTILHHNLKKTIEDPAAAIEYLGFGWAVVTRTAQVFQEIGAEDECAEAKAQAARIWDELMTKEAEFIKGGAITAVEVFNAREKGINRGAEKPAPTRYEREMEALQLIERTTKEWSQSENPAELFAKLKGMSQMARVMGIDPDAVTAALKEGNNGEPIPAALYTDHTGV